MRSDYSADRIHKFGSNLFAVPRFWSNAELRRFSPLFQGRIINVSAWRDEDKEGNFYKSYFPQASVYHTSNLNTDYRGYQGNENEIELDLMSDLPEGMQAAYDVVFNHTVLEHVYDFRKAFANLCAITRDMLIVVVPFVQQMHSRNGDFWRFSPEAVKRMFEGEGMVPLYISFNNHPQASVYVFAIGTKHPEKWAHLQTMVSYDEKQPTEGVFHPMAGCNSILPR